MSKYKYCGELICPYTFHCVLMEENPDAEYPCYMPDLPEWMSAIRIYTEYTYKKAMEKHGNINTESVEDVAYINPV